MARLRSQVDRQKGQTEDSTSELSSTTAELADARRLVQSLRTEVMVLQRVNEELETSKAEAYEKNEELAAALETAQAELLRMNSALTDKAGESTAAREEAVEARQAVAEETRVLQDRAQAAEVERDAAVVQQKALTTRVAGLQAELERVKSETRVAQLEGELEAARTALVGAGEENEHLHEQLARAEDTIEDLVDKVQSVDELQRESAAAARADERARMAAQLEAMEGLEGELEAERLRYKELQAQLAEEQVKAEDLRFRNQQYEAGYGMSDLVGELDAMRSENAKLQADLTAAGEDLKERTDTVYTLTEIARRLARETGKYPDDVNVFTIYDTGDLVAQHASLVEQYRMDNAVLERQVEELQAERVRLMREMRIQARQTGEDGLFYFGLTGDQMRLVNEFAENLRQGKAQVPERDESAALRRQLEAVRRQMFEERAKFAEASLAFNAALGEGRVASAPQPPSGPSSSELESVLAAMRGENERLRQEMRAMSDTQAERLRALVAAGVPAATTPLPDSSTDPESDPATQRIIKLLRKAVAQEKGLRSKDVPTTLQSLLGALRARQLAQSEAASASASAETAGLQRDAAEGRAKAASTQLSDVAASKAQLEGRVAGLQEDLADARARIRELEGQGGAMVPSTPRTPGFATGVAGTPWTGGEVPMTPVGKALLTRTLDTAQLPPLAGSWATEVASVHAALVAALEELVRREGAVNALEGTLTRYDGAVATISAQLVALYRAHIAGQQGWKASVEAAKRAEDAQRQRAEAAGHKARLFDELVQDLSGDGGLSEAEAGREAGAGGEGRPPEALIKSLRSHVRRQGRRLAELEAKVPLLQQEVHVTKTQAAAAAARHREAEAEVLEVQSTLRHRVLYLELWKRGGEARLARLSEVMREWVPAHQADATAKALAELRARHAMLLAEEATLRAEHVQLRASARDASATAAHNALLATQLEEARARAEASEAACADLRSTLRRVGQEAPEGEEAPGGPVARLASASREQLLAEVARLRASLSETTVRLDAAAASARVLQERVSELSAEVAAECTVANAAEARAKAAVEDKLAALRQSDGMAAKFAGGLTESEASALREELTAMRERCEGLEREVQRANGVADIASDQSTAATAMVKSREDEVGALRLQVAQLSSTSPDAAIIGKMQAEMVALKGSYAAFLRRYATLKTAVHRLRVAATAAETEADQRGAALTLALENARVKELALKEEVQELQRLLSASSEAGGGADGRRGVSLAEVETLNTHVRQLSSALEEARSRGESLQRQVRDGEDALALERESVKCLEGAVADVSVALGGPRVHLEQGGGDGAAQHVPGQRLADSLAKAARSAAAAAAATAQGSEQREVVRRVIHLHEKVRQSQLMATRAQRELARANDEVRLAVRRRGDAEDAVRALEDEVVSLRAEVARAEEARRAALAAAASSKAAAAEAARAAKTAAAMEPERPAGRGSKDGDETSAEAGKADAGAVTAAVAAAEGQVEEYRRQASKAAAAAAKWRAAAAQHKRQARARKARVTFLLRQLSLHGVEQDDLVAAGLPADADDSTGDSDRGSSRGGGGGGSSDDDAAPSARGRRGRPGDGSDSDDGGYTVDTAGMNSRGIRKAYEAELRHLQASAQHTVGQLRKLLDRKNDMVQQYAEKVTALQREVAAGQEAAAAREAARADEAFTAQMGAVARLKEAVDDIRTGAAGAGVEVATQKLTAELGERVDSLQQQVLLRDRRIRELDAQLTAMAGALESAEQRASSAEGRAAEATAELEAAQEANTASRLGQSVAALRKALDSKERKIKSLHAALAALKDEFVKIETEHAAAQAAWERDTADAQRRVEEAQGKIDELKAAAATPDDVRSLQERVKQLQGRLDAARAAADGLEHAKAALHSSLSDAQREIDAANDAKGVHRAAAERAWAEVKQLRAELADATRASERERAQFQTRLAELVAHGGAPVGPLRDGEGKEVDAAGQGTSADAVGKLRNRVQVLEAQNAALRAAAFEDAAAGATAPTPAAPAAAQEPRAPDAGQALGGSTQTRGGHRDVERKLRKRLETLTARLAAKSKEAEDAAADAASAQSTIVRLRSEKAKLSKRIGALSKKQRRLDDATGAALAELEPISELRAKVVELEAEAAKWRRAAEGELAAEVRRAKGDAEAERKRADAAEEAATQSEERANMLAGQLADLTSGGSGGLDASLRAGESSFVEEAALRERLAGARRTISGLESALLSRDATIADLRFELEESRAEVTRLQRRVRELGALSTLAGARGDAGAGEGEGTAFGAPAGMRGAGGGRESRLEDTIRTLKDVVNRQRRELDSAKAAAAKAGQSSGAPAQASSAAVQAGRELAATRSKLQRAEDRVKQLESDLAHAKLEGDSTQSELARERAARQAAEARARRQASKAAEQATQQPPPAPPQAADAHAAERVRALERENAALRQELSGLDMGFFEEVEDMKHQLAQAQQKCAAFDSYLASTGQAPFGMQGSVVGDPRRTMQGTRQW